MFYNVNTFLIISRIVLWRFGAIGQYHPLVGGRPSNRLRTHWTEDNGTAIVWAVLRWLVPSSSILLILVHSCGMRVMIIKDQKLNSSVTFWCKNFQFRCDFIQSLTKQKWNQKSMCTCAKIHLSIMFKISNIIYFFVL